MLNCFPVFLYSLSVEQECIKKTKFCSGVTMKVQPCLIHHQGHASLSFSRVFYLLVNHVFLHYRVLVIKHNQNTIVLKYVQHNTIDTDCQDFSCFEFQEYPTSIIWHCNLVFFFWHYRFLYFTKIKVYRHFSPMNLKWTIISASISPHNCYNLIKFNQGKSP